MFDIWHRKWLAADWGMHFKSRMTLYLLYRTVSPLLVFSFHRAINQARSNPTAFFFFNCPHSQNFGIARKEERIDKSANFKENCGSVGEVERGGKRERGEEEEES